MTRISVSTNKVLLATVKTPPALALIALLFTLLLPPVAPAAALALPLYSQHYDPKRDAFEDGKAAIKLATETGRHILIEVGGDWCSWCHILDRFIHADKHIMEVLNNRFVVLKINISDDNDNAQFMKGLPKPKGYPHMYVSRSNGSLIQSQDTAEFLKDGKYNRRLFLAFLTRWGPQP